MTSGSCSRSVCRASTCMVRGYGAGRRCRRCCEGNARLSNWCRDAGGEARRRRRVECGHGRPLRRRGCRCRPGSCPVLGTGPERRRERRRGPCRRWQSQNTYGNCVWVRLRVRKASISLSRPAQMRETSDLDTRQGPRRIRPRPETPPPEGTYPTGGLVSIHVLAIGMSQQSTTNPSRAGSLRCRSRDWVPALCGGCTRCSR
jgi:hypothetical protein